MVPVLTVVGQIFQLGTSIDHRTYVPTHSLVTSGWAAACPTLWDRI